MGDERYAVDPSVREARLGIRCAFQHIKDLLDGATRCAKGAETDLARFKDTFRVEVERVVREALDAFGRDVQAAFWETLLATPRDPFDEWKIRPTGVWSPFVVGDTETGAEFTAALPDELREYRVIGAQTKPLLDELSVGRYVMCRNSGGAGHSVVICVVVRSALASKRAVVVAMTTYTADRGVVETAPVSVDAYLCDNPSVLRAVMHASESAALAVSNIDAKRKWTPQRGKPDADAALVAATRPAYYAKDARIECVMRWTATRGTSAPHDRYLLVVCVRPFGASAGEYHVWDVAGKAAAVYKLEPERAALVPVKRVS
jgi:hypothetical protein